MYFGIHNVSSFLNTITYLDEPPDGKIQMDFYVLLIEGDTDIYSDKCPIIKPMQRRCKLDFYYQVCGFKNWVTHEDFKEFKTDAELSFRVDRDQKYFTTYRHYLTCYNHAMTKINYKYNKRDYRPNGLLLSNATPIYSKWFYIETLALDLFNQGGIWWRTSAFPILITVTMDLLQFNQQVEFSGTYYTGTVLETTNYIYRYISRCEKNHYGKTCWFHCENTTQRSCICPDKYIESISSCQLECNDMYLPRYISWKIRDFRDLEKICDIVNPCNTNNCSVLCLPIDNSTYSCEDPKYLIRSIYSTSNITSYIFYFDELLDITVDKTSFSTFFNSMEYSAVIFIDREQDIFTSGVLILLYSGYHIRITGTELDKFFQFNLGIYLEFWDSTINFTRHFRIYHLPGVLLITSLSTWEPVQLYLQVNETISCNSSVSPFYRAVYLWFTTLINLTTLFGPITSIGFTTTEYYTPLVCLCYLIVEDRPIEKSEVKKSVRIKAILYHRWSTYNNVLNNSDNLNCSARAFVAFSMYVQQMDGFEHLNVTPNYRVILSSAPSDFYSFICLLTSTLAGYFTTYTYFYLRNKPQFVCFYLHSNTRGSTVQCGHNGIFRDEYRIRVKFYFKEYYWELLSQSVLYVKIPYLLQIGLYMVHCNISSIYNPNQVISRHVITTPSILLKKEYPITRDNIMCPHYYPDIDPPFIINMTETAAFIQHFQFNATFIYYEELVPMFFLTFLVIIFGNYGTISLYVFLRDNDKTIIEMAQYVISQRQILIRMKLHLKLFGIAKRLIREMHGEIQYVIINGQYHNIIKNKLVPV